MYNCCLIYRIVTVVRHEVITSSEDVDSLLALDLIAAESIENLEAALEQFYGVAEELEKV